MHALDVSAAEVGEEHQVIVGAGGEQVLDEILVLLGGAFAGGHANDPFAAAPLRAVGTDVGPLDQSVVGQRDDDAFVGNQVFDGNFAFVRHQFGEAWRGVFFF